VACSLQDARLLILGVAHWQERQLALPPQQLDVDRGQAQHTAQRVAGCQQHSAGQLRGGQAREVHGAAGLWRGLLVLAEGCWCWLRSASWPASQHACMHACMHARHGMRQPRQPAPTCTGPLCCSSDSTTLPLVRNGSLATTAVTLSPSMDATVSACPPENDTPHSASLRGSSRLLAAGLCGCGAAARRRARPAPVRSSAVPPGASTRAGNGARRGAPAPRCRCIAGVQAMQAVQAGQAGADGQGGIGARAP
jgi:hypothetical protein